MVERTNRRRPRQEKGVERAEFLQQRLAESERQRISTTAEVALLNYLIHNERQGRKEQHRNHRSYHPQQPYGGK